MRVLIVKTSSLGDLIHTLPAVTDAARALPGIRFDWLAEEAFAEIPGWHPAVQRTIPIALRRWRKHWRKAWRSGELAAFWRTLREQHYDRVIDAQGLLLKSALPARLARGPSHGLSWQSAREPLSSLLYGQRHAVATGQHAIERVRQLFADVLGYTYDPAELDYGLRPEAFTSPVDDPAYAVLLHGTSWPSKRLATEQWIDLGRQAAARGLAVYLPWGSESERQTAEAIAAALVGEGSNAQVLPRLNLTALAGLLARARCIIGVDTGLAHLGAALGTPGVTLYTATFPALTGARGGRQSCVLLGGETPPAQALPHLRLRHLPVFDAAAIWRTLH
jgi:heptosyltransferase-1